MKKLIVNPDGTAIIIEYEKNNDNLKILKELPSVCENCSNNPANGGNGVCHCILGTPKIN